MQLALAAAAAALSGLGEDLGGTAALGGGLAETFQRLLPRIFFFFSSLFFFPGVSDGDGWGEEGEQASAVGANAALWLSARSVSPRMSVCLVSPSVPPQERSSNGEWPQVPHLSYPRSLPPAGAASTQRGATCPGRAAAVTLPDRAGFVLCGRRGPQCRGGPRGPEVARPRWWW